MVLLEMVERREFSFFINMMVQRVVTIFLEKKYMITLISANRNAQQKTIIVPTGKPLGGLFLSTNQKTH